MYTYYLVHNIKYVMYTFPIVWQGSGTSHAFCRLRPDITGGRVSLVIFFYPDADNLERQWQTITEEDDEGKSTVTDAAALHIAY